MMTETFREATQVQSFATGLIGNREAAAPDVEVKAEWITPTGAGDPPFKSGWHARAGRPASLALALLALARSIKAVWCKPAVTALMIAFVAALEGRARWERLKQVKDVRMLSSLMEDQVDWPAGCTQLNTVTCELCNLHPQLPVSLNDLVLGYPRVAWRRVRQSGLQKAFRPAIEQDKVNQIGLIVGKCPPGKGVAKQQVGSKIGLQFGILALHSHIAQSIDSDVPIFFRALRQDLLFLGGALMQVNMMNPVLLILLDNKVNQAVGRLKGAFNPEASQALLLSVKAVRPLRLRKLLSWQSSAALME